MPVCYNFLMKKIRYTDFEQIGITLDNIVSSSNLAGKIKKYNLSKVWGQVVGKRFESRSYPDTLSNKVLKVACENSVITSELVMSKRLIMQKLTPLAKSLGLDIEDIMFSHKNWRATEN